MDADEQIMMALSKGPPAQSCGCQMTWHPLTRSPWIMWFTRHSLTCTHVQSRLNEPKR